jgi:hypothetical protein
VPYFTKYHQKRKDFCLGLPYFALKEKVNNNIDGIKNSLFGTNFFLSCGTKEYIMISSTPIINKYMTTGLGNHLTLTSLKCELNVKNEGIDSKVDRSDVMFQQTSVVQR